MHDLPDHEVIDGLDVFRCTFRPAAIPRVFHAALAGYVSPEVPRVLLRFKPDVIHFTCGEWWGANLTTYLASLGSRHVLSTIYHNMPHTRGTAPLYTVNRRLAPRMDVVHALTEVERQQVHDAYSAPLDRTIVIPPGIEPVTRVPDRAGRSRVTVLAVGRLNAHKGQLRLVSMVQRLVQDCPDLPVRLWLAGDDDEDGAAIRRFVGEHGLENVVQLFGHCPDETLWELYQQADIFALPTGYESFGIVFVEAMAHGLPVVTYGVGPVPSVLTRGAIVVPPGDEQAFSDALLDLIRDPERRRRLGAEGRALTEASYTWQAVTERFHDVYARLSEPSRVAARA
jgi:glycosyltransferase involved in cell wall biosynthesis